MVDVRKPFQGVFNIIRFNWHYFVVSIGMILALLFASNYFNSQLSIIINILCLLAILAIIISLSVSFYVYDRSNLYKLDWLNLDTSNKYVIANINAGFDETSKIIQQKFANSKIRVFDFYDETKHTEISIKRARKSYPPYPNTMQITTKHIPLENESVDNIFLFLSAHEIRNSIERTLFFVELNRVLKEDGHIIITEHLQDKPNFLAYNIGAFHFHKREDWLENFQNAKLEIVNEFNITPFITTFTLKKNGHTA